MSLQHENLQNLLALAQETSSDKRRELLEGVTDLFFADDVDMNDAESALADDILGQVSDQVEEHVRMELSHRFSGAHQAPPGLIKKLANDIIEVARPILTKSGVLSDEDLREIIATMGNEHQLAITRRETISEAVSDALIENGNEEVLVSLVENERSQISRDGLEKLVEKSEGIEGLHAPLLQRDDLPHDLMHDMFWFVGSALKRVIMTKSDVDEDEVNKLLAEREAAFQQQGGSASDALTPAEKQVRRMARLGQLNHGTMAQLLRQGEKEQFVAALAYLTEIDLGTAKRITNSPSREAIAIACRASDFDLSTFSSIALLLNEEGTVGGQMRTPAEVAILLELYNKIPVDAAKRTMRFWRIRKTSMGEEALAPQ
jgi:uncharacterized protein (DUF2336 family)